MLLEMIQDKRASTMGQDSVKLLIIDKILHLIIGCFKK